MNGSYKFIQPEYNFMKCEVCGEPLFGAKTKPVCNGKSCLMEYYGISPDEIYEDWGDGNN